MIINNENLSITIAKKEDLKNLEFDCGDKNTNEFILKDALMNIELNLSVIYLCMYKDKVVAYFAISTDSIEVNKPFKVRYKYYPAVKIGRLAVDKKYVNKKLGSEIIGWIIKFCLEERKSVGIRLISVDAYVNAIDFYKKNLFEQLKSKKTKTIPMYLDLNAFD